MSCSGPLAVWATVVDMKLGHVGYRGKFNLCLCATVDHRYKRKTIPREVRLIGMDIMEIQTFNDYRILVKFQVSAATVKTKSNITVPPTIQR